MSVLASTVLGVIWVALVSNQTSIGTEQSPLKLLESKLHGEWQGQGACDGVLTIESDGTFRRRHYSPGNVSMAGTWHVEWHELPPTLIMKCAKSDDADRIGSVHEVSIMRLNGSELEYRFSGRGTGTKYKRTDPYEVHK